MDGQPPRQIASKTHIRDGAQSTAPDPGLLYHSDRGSQFTNPNYGVRLALGGIVVSMSQKGDCYDNAIIESFFSSFKVGCVDGQACQSCSQAR